MSVTLFSFLLSRENASTFWRGSIEIKGLNTLHVRMSQFYTGPGELVTKITADFVGYDTTLFQEDASYTCIHKGMASSIPPIVKNRINDILNIHYWETERKGEVFWDDGWVMSWEDYHWICCACEVCQNKDGDAACEKCGCHRSNGYELFPTNTMRGVVYRCEDCKGN
jgi:hypothetical protein